MTQTTTLVAALALALSLNACARSEPPRRDDATPTTEPAPAKTTAAPAKAEPEPAAKGSVQEEYEQLALKNTCPNGFPLLQGTWRFIGESKMKDYRATLTVAGTKMSEELYGVQDSGAVEKGTLAGEVRCLHDNRVLWMVDKVTPDGAFGNRSGDRYPCDVLGDLSGRGEKMLIICYFDWDLRTAAGLEFEFEKVPPATK